MNRILTSLTLAGCLSLAFTLTAQADDKKVDPTGTWTWSAPERDGHTREASLKSKLEGDKLTGAVSGRNNTETAIEDGKFKGDEISFKVTRKAANGNEIVTKYSG